MIEGPPWAMPRRAERGPFPDRADFPDRPAGKRTQLERALSKLGLCSRAEAARRVAEGRVTVNGVAATSPRQWVDLGRDRIDLDGTPVRTGEAGDAAAGAEAGRRGVYLALHKPPGYVTTRSDELGRETVYDLLPEEYRGSWIFPVGRLDRESEGLLLLTDDGAWADRLTDPAFHVDKVYRVKLDGRPSEEDLRDFREGVEIGGKRTLPAGLEPDGGNWYKVILREGRNRQIRRMFHALGYKVRRLVRVSIGRLELGDLPPGGIRVLTRDEAMGAGSPPRRDSR
jgi:23S rRNA pseudouridine2605 synthase